MVRLEFDKPSDLFDTSAITKTPIFSDDFTEWIFAAFKYAPRYYKLDLDIAFNNLEGYTEEELRDVLDKNVLLEAKKVINETLIKNKIAPGLCGLGFVMLIIMILVRGNALSKSHFDNALKNSRETEEPLNGLRSYCWLS